MPTIGADCTELKHLIKIQILCQVKKHVEPKKTFRMLSAYSVLRAAQNLTKFRGARFAEEELWLEQFFQNSGGTSIFHLFELKKSIINSVHDDYIVIFLTYDANGVQNVHVHGFDDERWADKNLFHSQSISWFRSRNA